MSRTELGESATYAAGDGTQVAGAVPRRPWWASLLRPVVAVPTTIVALLVAAPLAYRSAQIAGLPPIDHPFDVEASGTIAFAPEENAAPLYAAASTALVRFDTLHPGVEAGEAYERALESGWAAADERFRNWVRANGAALRAFREASAKPVYVVHQPKDVQIDSLLPQVQELREFARLSVLEGTRLEADGDFAGAWETYLAALRCSRLCGSHGTLIERLVGIAILAQIAPHAVRWAGNPQVEASLLRRATGELQAALDRTAAPSESLRSEYHLFRNTLARRDLSPGMLAALSGGPGPLGGIAPAESVLFFLSHEPEISDRALRHVYANWLEYVDRPRWDRPPTAGGRYDLFEPLPGDLPHVLRPAELTKYLDRSILARLLLPAVANIDAAIGRDQAVVVLLRTSFAAQRAFRDEGAYPARAEDLAPKYLSAAPRDPWDPVGAPVKLRIGPGGHLLVWSVGANGIDDGGRTEKNDWRAADIALDAAPVEVLPATAEPEAGDAPSAAP